MFQGEVAVHLKVLADALDHLEINVVERCAAGRQARGTYRATVAPGRDGLGRRAGDEVAGRLLIAQAHLKPLIAAQVIGKPSLSTLVLPADPIAEELALVGIALLLMPSQYMKWP